MSSELQALVKQSQDAISECNARLSVLAEKAAERVQIDAEEDRLEYHLATWCIHVRHFVLVPSTEDLSAASCPLPDGSLSLPMLKVLRDAEQLKIENLPDVRGVANAFRCIGWACLAMTVLAKKPTLKAMQKVIAMCSSITLPDEKSVRMMRAMVQKTSQWQTKVRKALAPKPEERRPFNVQALMNLKRSALELPLDAPEMFVLNNAINENGARHCICGGPNDGTFMLSCDNCEGWFHGRCVGVGREDAEPLDTWYCPPCYASSYSKTPETLSESDICINWEGEAENDIVSESKIPPDSPTPTKLWPPFGLLDSKEALNVLGEECISIRYESLASPPDTNASGGVHSADGRMPSTDSPTSPKSGDSESPRRLPASLANESEYLATSVAPIVSPELQSTDNVGMGALSGGDKPQEEQQAELDMPQPAADPRMSDASGTSTLRQGDVLGTATSGHPVLGVDIMNDQTRILLKSTNWIAPTSSNYTLPKPAALNLNINS